MTQTWQTRYLPPSQSLWQGRADSLPGERLFQRVQCHDLRTALPIKQNHEAFAFLGFACDEGVKRNHGRPGAQLAPAALRTACAKLPVHLEDDIDFYDFGDVTCHDSQLEEAQAALQEIVHTLIQQGFKPIILGGGNEVSFGHYLGIRSALPSTQIGIINLDAHFDLRPLSSDGKGTSGTPFRQIANFCKTQQLNFDYYVLGIQKFANTHSLFQTAEDLAVNYIFAEEIRTNPLANYWPDLEEFINGQEAIYLTLDLDVMASAYAPGVSAMSPLGLTPYDIIPIIRKIVKTGKVVSFDVAELAPALDVNNMTAQLAATLILEYIHA